ncbi:MAG: hypothetical protein HZT40_07205 [Candidatus Thiothrix singaporensis]|uniref:Fe-S cluster assembly protein SufD n=1 Tax=Candidatus Thiothrix singaporensis TaxID=2799669 RepID=A0A7L6AQN8_9GAMM|nr:MAG: hypothetical protein HZT40_07205 [Candidatus Thiothrix singaporensis]
MNSAPSVLQHYRRLAADQSGTAHDWRSRRQLDAVMQVQELPLPDRRSESWRYTPLPPLLEQPFQPAEPEEELLYADDVAQLRLTDAGNPCIVLLNGFLCPAFPPCRMKAPCRFSRCARRWRVATRRCWLSG